MPTAIVEAARRIRKWLLDPLLDDDEDKDEDTSDLRPGLPPLELRRVWAEWLDADGDILIFSNGGTEAEWEDEDIRQERHPQPAEDFAGGTNEFCPHGTTWAAVEAMAAAAK